MAATPHRLLAMALSIPTPGGRRSVRDGNARQRDHRQARKVDDEGGGPVQRRGAWRSVVMTTRDVFARATRLRDRSLLAARWFRITFSIIRPIVWPSHLGNVSAI